MKGCEVGRWTNPDTKGKQIIKVLKDNNFEGQHIILGILGVLTPTVINIDVLYWSIKYLYKV